MEEISAEVLKAPLNAANNRALIAIQLKGTVRYPKGGFLPFISEAHISERFRNEKGAQTGDILITPIVSVKEDPSYKGEPVPFDIKVQKILHTFQWGKNEYMIQSENRKTTLELFQKK